MCLAQGHKTGPRQLPLFPDTGFTNGAHEHLAQVSIQQLSWTETQLTLKGHKGVHVNPLPVRLRLFDIVAQFSTTVKPV